MAKKYYAVRKGNNTGIFETWEECKNSVNGFSGAEYKSFTNIEDAKEYIGIEEGITVDKNTQADNIKKETKKSATPKTKKASQQQTNNSNGEVKPIRSTAKVNVIGDYIEPNEVKENYDVICFVDGSYDSATKIYGCGIIILENNGTMSRCNFSGFDRWDQWNIVGELEATKYAISLAKMRGYSSIAVYHDLKNSALWASGEWQAKNEYTQQYVRFIEEASNDLDITFIKVKSHVGFLHNEQADLEAKAAIEMHLKQFQDK